MFLCKILIFFIYNMPEAAIVAVVGGSGSNQWWRGNDGVGGG